MNLVHLVQVVAINAIPLLLAITLHEAAHGYAARHFGDSTAAMLGRLSLNPIRHIDPIGTIAVPILIVALTSLSGTGGFLFGWAKPVPVSINNLRNPKLDMIWVAAAGPAANLLMALGWGLAAMLLQQAPSGGVTQFWTYVAGAGIIWNVALMVLNLLPLLPLDGGRILAGLLPNRLSYAYSRLEPYGLFILLALVFTGTLGAILGPLQGWVLSLIGKVFALA
jgi:Zn-dependent protease